MKDKSWKLEALFKKIIAKELWNFLSSMNYLDQDYFCSEILVKGQFYISNRKEELKSFFESQEYIEELRIYFCLPHRTLKIDEIEFPNNKIYLAIRNNGDSNKRMHFQANNIFPISITLLSNIWTMTVNNSVLNYATGRQDIKKLINEIDLPVFFPKPNPEIDFINDKKAYYLYQEKLVLHHHFLRENDEIIWLKIAPILVVPGLIFKYIPKSLWLNLKEVELIKELKNGHLLVIIFSNPVDSLNEQNYLKLWSVRKQLGIDTICHEICEPVKHLNYIDPTLPVVITLKNVQKGFTRVTRYLDKNGNLVEPQKAQTMEIKEYLEDGETCVLEEVKKKGIFGWK